MVFLQRYKTHNKTSRTLEYFETNSKSRIDKVRIFDFSSIDEFKKNVKN